MKRLKDHAFLIIVLAGVVFLAGLPVLVGAMFAANF